MSLSVVTVTIKLTNAEGHAITRDVDGWALGYIDGLALTPTRDPAIYVYNVTHTKTGLAVVSEINRIMPALNCLDELGGLGIDWTQDNPGATMTKSQKRRLAQIKEKYHDKD